MTHFTASRFQRSLMLWLVPAKQRVLKPEQDFVMLNMWKWCRCRLPWAAAAGKFRCRRPHCGAIGAHATPFQVFEHLQEVCRNEVRNSEWPTSCMHGFPLSYFPQITRRSAAEWTPPPLHLPSSSHIHLFIFISKIKVEQKEPGVGLPERLRCVCLSRGFL